MAKPPALDHVKWVRSKGRLYAYFNTGQKHGGKPIYARLPDPSAPGFYDAYAAFMAGRTKRAAKEYTVAVMADEYMRSPEYRGKADATQKLYAIQIGKAVDRLGALGADTVEARHVLAILDKEGWNPGTRNSFLSALGALYKWGRSRGKTRGEPVRNIEKLKGGAHEPWPQDILDAALASDEDVVRLAVHLLFWTGQRIGDVCRMRWGDIRDGEMHVRQEKTSKRLTVPLASDLRAELDRTPRTGLTILVGPAGRPLRPAELRARLKAFTLGLGVRTVPHGLRKNAVNGLLLAQCTVPEVAAITGQSYAMVEHYAARIERGRLASAAILKWEQSAAGKTSGKTARKSAADQGVRGTKC